MTANQQSALAALNAVRPIAERLDRARDGEDRAADILELWEATETALRALMGGSALTGQGLIRELRQRELITLGQAYALLEFLGARDRANRTSYKSTPSDVQAAREGYRQLEAGLKQEMPAAAGSSPATAAAGTSSTVNVQQNYGPPAAAAAAAQTSIPPAAGETAPRREWRSYFTGKNRWLLPTILGALIVAGILIFFFTRPSQADLGHAVDLMRTGKREAGRGEFARIARDNPRLSVPHIFLARLSREDGDLNTARAEADTAVRLDPTNSAALREMGLTLFASKNYDLARNFFVRAIKANPNDLSAQGYLGCALVRLGRNAEGNTWISRAGPGIWTSCAQAPAAATNPPPIP